MEIEEFITVLGGDTSSDRVCRRSCFRELLSPCGAARVAECFFLADAWNWSGKSTNSRGSDGIKVDRTLVLSSSNPSLPPSSSSKARLCISTDRRMAAPLAPPPILFGLASGLAGGVCFEKLVLGHGLCGGWVACSLGQLPHRLVYGLASVVFDVALLGLSTDLADLVSSGGGFMLSFGSYAVSDSGEFCWARLRFRCCVSWTSIQGIVGAGECVTPVSEDSWVLGRYRLAGVSSSDRLWCLGCEKWRLSGGDQRSAAIIPMVLNLGVHLDHSKANLKKYALQIRPRHGSDIQVFESICDLLQFSDRIETYVPAIFLIFQMGPAGMHTFGPTENYVPAICIAIDKKHTGRQKTYILGYRFTFSIFSENENLYMIHSKLPSNRGYHPWQLPITPYSLQFDCVKK
ncbi:LOW QUALITY PROTEIN: hypothetical protein YC2023_057616 [Brassica napus]